MLVTHFWKGGGDLNFRILTTESHNLTTFPVLAPKPEPFKDWNAFIPSVNSNSLNVHQSSHYKGAYLDQDGHAKGASSKCFNSLAGPITIR